MYFKPLQLFMFLFCGNCNMFSRDADNFPSNDYNIIEKIGNK